MQKKCWCNHSFLRTDSFWYAVNFPSAALACSKVSFCSTGLNKFEDELVATYRHLSLSKNIMSLMSVSMFNCPLYTANASQSRTAHNVSNPFRPIVLEIGLSCNRAFCLRITQQGDIVFTGEKTFTNICKYSSICYSAVDIHQFHEVWNVHERSQFNLHYKWKFRCWRHSRKRSPNKTVSKYSAVYSE